MDLMEELHKVLSERNEKRFVEILSKIIDTRVEAKLKSINIVPTSENMCPVCKKNPIAPGRDTCVDCSH